MSALLAGAEEVVATSFAVTVMVRRSSSAVTLDVTMAAVQSQDMARLAIHPGEHLAEELQELGISAAELARQLKVPTNRVTGILNGKRAVTADTALRLGHWFGVSAQFWLNLQTLYELRLAESEVGAEIRKLPKRKAA